MDAMTDHQQKEIKALVAALAELTREALQAAADGRLEVQEIIALGGDCIRVGQALRDLATPNTPLRPLLKLRKDRG